MNPPTSTDLPGQLRLRRLGIDTYQEPMLYVHRDDPLCRSEGFEAQSRVQMSANGNTIIATLNVVHGDFMALGEAGVSEAAWCARLDLEETACLTRAMVEAGDRMEWGAGLVMDIPHRSNAISARGLLAAAVRPLLTRGIN